MVKQSWKSAGLGSALIVLLTLVAYIPAMRGGFIWDDDDYVTQNLTLRSAGGLSEIWLNPDKTAQYYPLTFTVFWIEYHLWGLHPFGFHLVNILLQAINALLFWRLLSGLRVPGAWWAAAVFALHPVNVMSVAWITELKNVLSGFFYLAALLTYHRFCGLDAHGGTRQERLKWFFGLALVLYLCALLSKTSTSIFPMAILLILWWKHGRVGRKELAAVLPFVVVTTLFGGFTLFLEKYAKGASGEEFALSITQRALVAGRSFWFSLGKLIWPAQLTFIYPRWRIDHTVVSSYSYPLGVIALLAVLWWLRRWLGRAPLAAMIYFALAFPALVMVQTLFMMQYSFVSDHWQYLGSMAVIPLGVGGAVTALTWWKPPPRKHGFVVGTVVLVSLGLLTWRQGHIYRNLETLWRDTLAKNPDAWMAHNNLGFELANQGRVPEAIAEYAAALRIKPDYADAHNNLGVALANQGRISEATAEFTAALRIKRGFAEPHNNLANTLIRQGRLAEAVAEFTAALRIKPDFAEAHNNLANTLIRQGRLAKAVAECQAALRIKPDFAEAHNNLALALAGQGKLAEATAEYAAALRIKPDLAEAHNNLANTLIRQGRLAEAVAECQAALRIKPDFAEAHYNLGNVLASQGSVAEATAEYQAALRIKPDFAEAHNNLANTLIRQGRLAEAVAECQAALRIKPDDVEAHYNMGNALASQGRIAEATTEYRETLRLRPDWPPALGGLAWILATSSNESVRNGGEAVQLAERLCAVSGCQEADGLDVLAAAYAEAGRFDDAVRVAQRAVEAATAAGPGDLAGQIQERLKLYRASRPYRAGPEQSP